MIELGGFALLRPWWLAALPVIAIAALFARRAADAGGWRRAIDPPLLAGMAARGGFVAGDRASLMAPLLVALCLAMGLSGPALQRTRIDAYRNLDALVICLDASRSLTGGGSLVAATAAARALAEAAGTRQVALIVYAGDAYLAAAPTADREDLLTVLASIDGDSVPDVGSRPERALALAGRILKEASIVGGDVVLLSDGGRADGDVAAAAAALGADGHVLHTVFVPPSAAYAGVVPAAERAGLDRLAAAAGGSTASLVDIDRLLSHLGERREIRLGRSDYAALAWRDLGLLFVLAAAAALLLLFRREGA